MTAKSPHTGEYSGPEERVARRLAAKGHQITVQRMRLARLIFARPQHLSAEDVLRMAVTAGIKVSKATVYNTLNLFSERGLVREVNVDPVRKFYDSTTHPHQHFYNVDTGELADIPDAQVAFEQLPELPEGTESESVEVLIRVRGRT